MTVTKLRVQMLHKHSDACSAVKQWPENPWAYFGSRDGIPYKAEMEVVPMVLMLASNGKKQKNQSQQVRWLTVGCNSLDCKGTIAVHEGDLLTLAQTSLRLKRR